MSELGRRNNYCGWTGRNPQYCGWTKSISHHLRNPGMMIPPVHTNQHWFSMGSIWCRIPSIHFMLSENEDCMSSGRQRVRLEDSHEIHCKSRTTNGFLQANQGFLGAKWISSIHSEGQARPTFSTGLAVFLHRVNESDHVSPLFQKGLRCKRNPRGVFHDIECQVVWDVSQLWVRSWASLTQTKSGKSLRNTDSRVSKNRSTWTG